MDADQIWDDFHKCKEPYYRVVLSRPSLALAKTEKERDILASIAPNVALDIDTKLLGDERFACLKAVRDLDDRCAFELLLMWWSMFGVSLSMNRMIPVDAIPGDGLAADLHQCGLATVVKRKKKSGVLRFYSVHDKCGKHTKVIGADIADESYPCKFLKGE